MPEQPHPYERTLDMPPQDPWAGHAPEERTAAAGAAPPAYNPFTQGRARVTPQTQPQQRYAEHEPTGVGWPGAGAPPTAPGMSWRWSDLRGGSEWTTAAVLFAFVCWGIWALSGGGPLITPVIVFLVTLIVAAGVFCLARVVGYLVLERQLGRRRRSARGSHLVTALFLAGVAIADLQQTEWVMTAYHWVADNLS
ncbi:DNA-directed RNA polymerase II [Actinoplanes sp. CA-030573]|uniref:DNA-directed RNA polymerase II n=1 Tax=Actinoplanes sp. CA-030573 TaxID=3239898 RepID=UPI003D94756E